MRHLLPAGLLVVVPLSIGTPSAAQHCGGPCEVPRPAGPPISANPRFTLVPGKEKSSWRYLHNFIWTEDGEQKSSLYKTLSSPQMIAFGYRRIFVSPAGNGFLVTGNAYARGDNFLLSGRTHARIAPLFVFCSEEGTPLVEVSLREGLTKEEIKRGPCPSCKCCKDILYVFKKDPALSANGCFVELDAAGSGRTLSFCLPLGAPIKDRAAFENRLAELEWARIPADLRRQKRAEIQALVAELGGDDAQLRAEADKGLVALGFLALPVVRASRTQTESKEQRARIRGIEERLKPWAATGYERMSVDLDLLAALLSYPEAAVVKAVRTRLAQLLPDEGASDWGPWIKKHRDRLQWDSKLRRYTLKR